MSKFQTKSQISSLFSSRQQMQCPLYWTVTFVWCFEQACSGLLVIQLALADVRVLRDKRNRNSMCTIELLPACLHTVYPTFWGWSGILARWASRERLNCSTVAFFISRICLGMILKSWDPCTGKLASKIVRIFPAVFSEGTIQCLPRRSFSRARISPLMFGTFPSNIFQM